MIGTKTREVETRHPTSAARRSMRRIVAAAALAAAVGIGGVVAWQISGSDETASVTSNPSLDAFKRLKDEGYSAVPPASTLDAFKRLKDEGYPSQAGPESNELLEAFKRLKDGA